MEQNRTGLYLYESTHHAQDFLKQESFVTRSGCSGPRPMMARKDNRVVALLGLDVPSVLRKVDGSWKVIGESYVEEIIHGEAKEQW
jgi:hypothetical protein